MRPGGILKCVLLVVFLVVVAFLAIQILDINMDFTLNKIFTRSASSSHVDTAKLRRYKCGLSKSCPAQHFAFKITSGAASVVGPKICLDDTVLMSAVKNNVGRGINIALANAKTGKLIKTDSFDMWAGDVKLLIDLLKSIEPGTLVLMATFDDPATKLNAEAKNLISELGSTKIHSLSFRDNWIFVGGKGLQNKSPFEQHVKNSGINNKYDGWPEILEMEGCIPIKND